MAFFKHNFIDSSEYEVTYRCTEISIKKVKIPVSTKPEVKEEKPLKPMSEENRVALIGLLSEDPTLSIAAACRKLGLNYRQGCSVVRKWKQGGCVTVNVGKAKCASIELTDEQKSALLRFADGNLRSDLTSLQSSMVGEFDTHFTKKILHEYLSENCSFLVKAVNDDVPSVSETVYPKDLSKDNCVFVGSCWFSLVKRSVSSWRKVPKTLKTDHLIKVYCAFTYDGTCVVMKKSSTVGSWESDDLKQLFQLLQKYVKPKSFQYMLCVRNIGDQNEGFGGQSLKCVQTPWSSDPSRALFTRLPSLISRMRNDDTIEERLHVAQEAASGQLIKEEIDSFFKSSVILV
ncbi:hypothetical protein DICA3_F00430 [Diutina catenulata]